MARTYNSGAKGHSFGIGGTDYGKITTSGYLRNTTVTAVTAAEAATYTAADCIGGIITRDCTGAGRTDVLPTAALLVAALAAVSEPAIGDTLAVLIVNASDAAETITLTAGSGGTLGGTSATIAQDQSRLLLIRLTGVASGSEAYVAY